MNEQCCYLLVPTHLHTNHEGQDDFCRSQEKTAWVSFVQAESNLERASRE